jgi:cbb3-type cytochrome oxidase subunit 3
MFKQFVGQVSGHNIYLIISLLIFFIFFVAIALLLIKMNKKHIAYMSGLPLNDDKEEIYEGAR